jgi:hypothetical protein
MLFRRRSICVSTDRFANDSRATTFIVNTASGSASGSTIEYLVMDMYCFNRPLGQKAYESTVLLTEAQNGTRKIRT